MIYTELTARAMKIAYSAHIDQYDITGVPYIFHPFHVAEQMNDEISVCVALLHDVVEDTDITLEFLEKNFPSEVTEAVGLLTHKKGVPYEDYLKQIKENPVAKAVKLADIAHNSDFSRIFTGSNVSEEKILHWREKYKKARDFLENDD